MKDGLEHGPPTPPHYKAEKRSALGGINKVPSLKSFMGDLFASALYLGVEGGPVEKYIYWDGTFQIPTRNPFATFQNEVEKAILKGNPEWQSRTTILKANSEGQSWKTILTGNPEGQTWNAIWNGIDPEKHSWKAILKCNPEGHSWKTILEGKPESGWELSFGKPTNESEGSLGLRRRVRTLLSNWSG